MIVRDRGEGWQVVLQTDHADLSEAFALAWAERGPRHDSLAVAAKRHDDGWAVWERSPARDPATGRPIGFLDVDVPAHLAFYRACIATVSEQDPYAGLLVSMHGAGIYRQRYGRDPALGLTRAAEVQQLVDAFVDEQEAGFEERIAGLGVTEEERWRDYELLQIYDRLSLYFCMRDLEGGAAAGMQGFEVQGYELEPLGPWRIRMRPFPFGQGRARFELLRRVLAKDAPEAILATPLQRVELTIEP